MLPLQDMVQLDRDMVQFDRKVVQFDRYMVWFDIMVRLNMTYDTCSTLVEHAKTDTFDWYMVRFDMDMVQFDTTYDTCSTLVEHAKTDTHSTLVECAKTLSWGSRAGRDSTSKSQSWGVRAGQDNTLLTQKTEDKSKKV